MPAAKRNNTHLRVLSRESYVDWEEPEEIPNEGPEVFTRQEVPNWIRRADTNPGGGWRLSVRSRGRFSGQGFSPRGNFFSRHRKLFWIAVSLLLVGIVVRLAFFPSLKVKAIFHPIPPAPRLDLILPSAREADSGKVFYRVKKGDTLESILKKTGLAEQELKKIQTAITRLIKVSSGKKFALGKELELTYGPKMGLVELEFISRDTSRVVIRRTSDGRYIGKILQVPRMDIERVAVGEIRTSFAAAARDAGVPYDIVDDLVDLFSDRIDFNSDLRVGDRFTVIYRDQVSEDGVQLKAGPIIASALDIDGTRHIAVRYIGTDGKSRYFNGKGEPLGGSFLRYPLQFTRISSYFSFARFHPVLGKSRKHNGVDFAAPIGTPVRTVAGGKVLIAGRRGGAGIMVRIQHTPRFMTEYMHLSRISPGVRVGGAVEKGQLIGAVGTTGLSTGPHLHFGFFDNGKYVDPLKMKLPFLDDLGKGLTMPERYLKRALFTLNHYQKLNLKTLFEESR